jgi:hypothetical protein
MPTVSRCRRALLAGLAVAVALAAACGDDDDSASPDPDGSGSAEVTAEACDAYAGVTAAMTGDPAAAGDALARVEATAPAELAEEAAVVVTTLTELFETEDPAVLDDAEYASASAAIGDAYFDGCDAATKLEVTGLDYEFEGLPDRIDAGRVAVRFTNGTEHDEAHELLLFRRLEGTDETVEELVELPEEEIFSKVAMAGVVFVDEPGGESVALFDLEPGSYIAICFIPIGGEDGPPHFTGGMVAEFDAA